MAKKRPTTEKAAVESATIEPNGRTAVPLEFHVPDGLITPFATNMLVQSMEHELKVMFFEAKPVIRLRDTDPLPEKVRVDYVAGVIISAERLQKFIDAMQAQLDRFNAAKVAPESEVTMAPSKPEQPA